MARPPTLEIQCAQLAPLSNRLQAGRRGGAQGCRDVLRQFARYGRTRRRLRRCLRRQQLRDQPYGNKRSQRCDNASGTSSRTSPARPSTGAAREATLRGAGLRTLNAEGIPSGGTSSRTSISCSTPAAVSPSSSRGLTNELTYPNVRRDMAEAGYRLRRTARASPLELGLAPHRPRPTS